LGLHRDDIDVAASIVTVRRNRIELVESDVAYDGDPKTAASLRTVAIPPHLLPVLAEHLEQWAESKRVFVAESGQPMHGDAIGPAFARARKRVG
jgi:hypothetical protein